MTATRTPTSRPTPPPPPAAGSELTSAQWSMTVTPVVAAVTTLCAALALSGVIEGLRWWGYSGVAVTVVTAVGLGLRAVRTPILLVGLGQLFALICLLVALFTDSGVLGILPGPTAITDLGDVLRNSVEVVQTGVPPVPATTAVLCLVVIAIGLVAVLVDTLAVSAGTPAACGLVLLCVYAVPASLADDMLPWWAFVLGAISFAALLAVDGAHRHQQWRNRPTVQGTGGGFGSPAALVSGAVAVALLAGATVTAIGTVGQLPGGSGGAGSGGLGLNPFTQLRGMLDQDGNVELFRVSGLDDQPRYLRALTLPEYDDNGGWLRSDADRLPAGVEADRRPLPIPPGQERLGPPETTEIQIEAVGSEDVWAPVVGTPVGITGLPEGMRYDANSGMVYGERAQKLPMYVEEADLSVPTAQDLRADGDFGPPDVIDSIYSRNDGLDPRVTQLARDLTAGSPTVYDKVLAIGQYFETGNGFKYDTQTAVGSDEDALTDFLFESKTGFCEQYASSMGILLRAAGIPSRVAMGYTAGYPNGGYRTITTQNAHAWVEVFFPTSGWVMFDPTPLADGTTYTPPYVSEQGPSGPEDDPQNENTQAPTTTAPTAPTDPQEDDENPQAGADGDGQQQDDGNTWLWWAIAVVTALAIMLTVPSLRRTGGGAGGPTRRGPPWLAPLAGATWALVLVIAAAVVSWWLAALVVVLLIAAAPGLVRERMRRGRRHAAHSSDPAAATSAWTELLAESRDRGAEVSETETVRAAARRLARDHGLDEDGRRALRTVVSEVERSWYGGRNQPDPTLGPAFDHVVDGMRRSDPLSWRARFLPRSILNRRH